MLKLKRRSGFFLNYIVYVYVYIVAGVVLFRAERVLAAGVING